MLNGSQKRTRSERVAAIELPPGRVMRVLGALKRGDVLLRLLPLVAAAVAIWAVTGSWAPPFNYRSGYVPRRDVVARAAFKEPDPKATDEARERAASQVPFVFEQDPEPLIQLRGALERRLAEIAAAPHLADLGLGVWQEFAPPRGAEAPEPTAEEQEAAFQQFRALLGQSGNLDEIERGLERALAPFEQRGLLEKMPTELDRGNQVEIVVYPLGHPDQTQNVKLADVLVGDAQLIYKSLASSLGNPALTERVFLWLRPRLKSTLSLDTVASLAAREKAREAVAEQYRVYEPGYVLARAGVPLGLESLKLLELEHAAVESTATTARWIERSLAIFGLIGGLYCLCYFYIRRNEKGLLRNFNQFTTLLILVTATVALAHWMKSEPWRAELIPLMMFGMIVAIAFTQDLALILTSAVAVIMVVTLGLGPMLSELLVLCGTSATAILLLARIRSRPKLIKVGFVAAAAAVLLTLGAGVLEAQPIGWALWTTAGRNGLWAFTAGFLMSGVLPFIESLFGVLTDIKLLELGDVAHPLLQELVRRAPGTYNHSINVASIAEAAADAIGANGLLVRVGAYFHDIGKMLKPGYFVENLGSEANRHDSLVPAMSTLIIIAHIKDGADLARQHNLPRPIIDFIEQHHGTTLVEYFYRRANQQRENDPDAGDVDERLFRYPGPKPQTKEAAVLMLADAVESACRALSEPTAARIERLVDDIAMKRLLDGQFDECGIDLRQLHTVQESLIKSLTAVYHGRVKYPGQRTA